MKIAVIGTGNVGNALGRSLARAGHAVTFAERDAAKAHAVASELGVSAADTPASAAESAEAILLAVPFGAASEVAAALGESASGKVVIDPTNPLTPDYSGLATEGGPSAAERIADLLRGARVVKAFNTVFAGLQAAPDAHGTVLDALFATDDDDARAVVVGLIRSLGFRPVDVGPLEAARQMEALAWMNIRMQMRYGGDWQSSFVMVGAPAAATAASAASAASAA